jgi:tetratricopeptide (TPR) repeat protein
MSKMRGWMRPSSSEATPANVEKGDEEREEDAEFWDLTWRDRYSAAWDEVLKARLATRGDANAGHGDADEPDLEGAAFALEDVLSELEEAGLGNDIDGDDVDALDVRRALAEAYLQLGRFGEAADLLEVIVRTYEQVVGPGDLDTLLALAWLAAAYSGADRHDEAVACGEKRLSGYREELGAEYPDTLGAQFNLAGLVWRAGREAEATELYEQTLAVCQRVLGPDDELTKMLLDELTTIHEEAED